MKREKLRTVDCILMANSSLHPIGISKEYRHPSLTPLLIKFCQEQSDSKLSYAQKMQSLLHHFRVVKHSKNEPIFSLFYQSI